MIILLVPQEWEKILSHHAHQKGNAYIIAYQQVQYYCVLYGETIPWEEIPSSFFLINLILFFDQLETILDEKEWLVSAIQCNRDKYYFDSVLDYPHVLEVYHQKYSIPFQALSYTFTQAKIKNSTQVLLSDFLSFCAPLDTFRMNVFCVAEANFSHFCSLNSIMATYLSQLYYIVHIRMQNGLSLRTLDPNKGQGKSDLSYFSQKYFSLSKLSVTDTQCLKQSLSLLSFQMKERYLAILNHFLIKYQYFPLSLIQNFVNKIQSSSCTKPKLKIFFNELLSEIHRKEKLSI